MLNWLHHLFNPHCPECRICYSCETLKTELEFIRRQNQFLMEYLLPHKQQEIATQQIAPKALSPNLAWRMRAQMLESEDRKRAEIMRKQHEELEKELGIKEENENDGTTDSNSQDGTS